MQKLEFPAVEIEVQEAPIPPLASVKGWKEVRVEECGQKLVCLNDLDPNLIIIDSQYYKQGIKSSSPLLYAREEVAAKLLEAAKLLPSKHRLVIWDAWRQLEVQKALFDYYLAEIKAKSSGVSEEVLVQEAQKYVSLPSGDPTKPSPHYTGGAIDLTIMGPNGELLDMGTPFDYFGPESSLRFYEESGSLKDEEIIQNRRLLYRIMTAVGFSPYDEEWWHYDYGNQFDAKKTGKEFAIYGGITLPSES